ncbi:MAG: cell division topological specificity factor MinE [Eubacteriales bacterium]|nr:cell division topological specificity factor MinE [Eubacteriales bacterium]
MKKHRTYKTSGEVARDRLELLLLAEKMKSSPELMLQMKREIQRVLEKYLNLEHTEISIQMDIRGEIKQGMEHVKTIQIKGL